MASYTERPTPTRHHNLSNKQGDPTQTTISCKVTVTLDPYQGAFPRQKLIDWLLWLPEDAKIEFAGVASGKQYFTATWTEVRPTGIKAIEA